MRCRLSSEPTTRNGRAHGHICFTVGSLLPALLLGVALGNVIAGIPMAANGDYAGVPLLGLLSPFTLVAGLLGLAMCLSAGAAWVALKAPARLRRA